MATSVFPYPTSPHKSLSIGLRDSMFCFTSFHDRIWSSVSSKWNFFSNSACHSVSFENAKPFNLARIAFNSKSSKAREWMPFLTLSFVFCHAFVPSLKLNDYVVHIDHGIGIFRGFETMNFKGAPKDHIVIDYADGDRLYVPIEEMHLIQKYVGFERRPPKLYRLGTKAWQNTN